MRRSLPGIQCELAVAVRRVNAVYYALPEHLRPDVSGESWIALEEEINRACGARDRDAALQAIARWEKHTGDVLSRVKATVEVEG